MSERVVQPYLNITIQPSREIKFLKSCQFNNINESLNKKFHEISLECKLNNLDVINLPNINLYALVSIVLDNHDISNSNSHPFALKCSNTKTRLLSKILQPNISNKKYLFEINKDTMKCAIKDLYVVSLSPSELEEYYETIYIEHLNASWALQNRDLVRNISDDESSSMNSLDINSNINKMCLEIKKSLASNTKLNKLKVKIQVVIHNLTTNKLENYLTEPLYSNLIEDGIPKTISQKTHLEDKNGVFYFAIFLLKRKTTEYIASFFELCLVLCCY